MGFLRRHRGYDRRRILEEAARARAKNQRRKAIQLYRWVLAVERSNPELHARLAPLLAETGQTFDAWQCFRATASAALRDGRDDKAIAIYREAARHLPKEIQVWQGLARLLTKRGDEAEAVEALLEGSRHYRSHWLRAQAIHLLRRARMIDPWHFQTVLELAGHLSRADQKPEARFLLDALAEREYGDRLRRIRAAQLRLDPSPFHFWRLVRAWLRPDEGPAPAPAPVRRPEPEAAPGVVPLRVAR